MKTFALVIDHDACWGCRTCEAACKQEFDVPDGVRLIAVSEIGPTRVGDKLDVVYHVSVCRHCDDPPCAESCPEEAISKREDGIVIMDYEVCTGCRLCMEACPFDAIDFDEDKEIARKCNLCHNRVDNGLLPACADNVCLSRCIHFGDPEVISNASVTKIEGASQTRSSHRAKNREI